VKPSAPRPTSYVLVGGAQVACAVPVIPWDESGLLFSAARVRRRRTAAVVVHWTGSENEAPQVHRNMTKRRCSCHFIVDARGVVWQTADADRQCAHVQHFNVRTIGIEVVCRGDDFDVPHKGVLRAEVEDLVHGRRVRYARFTILQATALRVLVTLLCDVYRLPVQVPVDRTGALLARTLSKIEADTFRGVAAHYHFNDEKNDCGPANLRLFLRGDDDATA
jgi:hypothetical protein